MISLFLSNFFLISYHLSIYLPVPLPLFLFFIYKVLTSALTVLEIQFEGAEKENKRIRNAGELSLY